MLPPAALNSGVRMKEMDTTPMKNMGKDLSDAEFNEAVRGHNHKLQTALLIHHTRICEPACTHVCVFV